MGGEIGLTVLSIVVTVVATLISVVLALGPYVRRKVLFRDRRIVRITPKTRPRWKESFRLLYEEVADRADEPWEDYQAILEQLTADQDMFVYAEFRGDAAVSFLIYSIYPERSIAMIDYFGLKRGEIGDWTRLGQQLLTTCKKRGIGLLVYEVSPSEFHCGGKLHVPEARKRLFRTFVSMWTMADGRPFRAEPLPIQYFQPKFNLDPDAREAPNAEIEVTRDPSLFPAMTPEVVQRIVDCIYDSYYFSFEEGHAQDPEQCAAYRAYIEECKKRVLLQVGPADGQAAAASPRPTMAGAPAP